jgi:hypothetical protein
LAAAVAAAAVVAAAAGMAAAPIADADTNQTASIRTRTCWPGSFFVPVGQTA